MKLALHGIGRDKPLVLNLDYLASTYGLVLERAAIIYEDEEFLASLEDNDVALD